MFGKIIAIAFSTATGLLMGCTSVKNVQLVGSQPSNLFWQPEAQSRWEQVKLPGKHNTHYSLVTLNGQNTLKANAQSSASMLRQKIRIEPDALNSVFFSWQVAELMASADMAERDHDDSPVRIVLAFEGDRKKFSMKNAILSELSHAMNGEPMPYATLMYVWCNHRPVNAVIENPRTDRIRKIVVESGSERLNQWLMYERNIRLDYENAFGEPPGALIGVGLMTDSDNTQSQVQAWYGAIQLK
ncbi:MAG: hypothetical protein RL203_316 [Pseudomonadota bacterium]